MNSELAPDVEAMCEAVRGLARRDFCGPETFEPQDFRRRWQLAGRQGLLGVTVPREYGGSGLDAVAAVALMEALGAGCTDTGFAFSAAAHLFACLMPIVEFGTSQQRQRWLPNLTDGRMIAAHAITEAEAGSDIFNMSTRAVRDGEHYVLDGSKVFTTNAPVADVFLVQAITRPGGGFFGVTAFLVEATTPGVRVGKPYEKIGLRGSPTAEVHFDQCRVPADCVLGGEGAGATVFTGSMKWERTCLFGIYLGGMRRVLDSTVAYASDREQFGTPIGQFQAVSHRIVDMLTRLEACSLLLGKAARELAAGGDCEVSAGIAKIAVSEAAVQLGMDAIQLRGALGVTGGDAETLLRDALPARIFSGTNEIQKNNVARALGLGRKRTH
ncbi:L-prolyl-[peptidyl-carrier protein] dehydrogenase [Nocardia sp. NPDC050435]|uniref:L-prolyl-[peptidyl-carrier protein] dehydrogenase n=1 Tax=Nocardia sp. NPDC050435 TaxID=3155040 RepID=UPI0033EAF28B